MRGYLKVRVQTVPLEEAEHLPQTQFGTPMEDFLAREYRSDILRGLPNVRSQMVFILREYGFQDREISRNMRVRLKTIQNIMWKIRKIRGKI